MRRPSFRHPRVKQRKKRVLLTALATVSMGLALTACSSSSASPGSASKASTGNSTGNKASSSRADAVVAKYSPVPSFIPPGPAFNAKKLDAGKTLFSIPVDSQDQFVQIIENDMKTVAKQVGINFVDYTNAGSPSSWATGMQQAVSQHANLIDLLAGINPTQLTPQMQAAKAAHIPVVASDAYDFSQKPDPLLSGVVDVNYKTVGTVMADWAIKQTGGNVHALVIESNDVVSSPVEGGAVVTAIKQNCSKCTAKVINVPVSDWASQTQTQVEAALRAHPNINYVMPVYDSQSQYITPAIALAGDTGKVHIVTYDGTAFVLKYLQEHKAVVMDVGEDLKWIAWAIMDQEMRIMAGLKPVKDEHTPLMIWTKKNVAKAGNPPTQSQGYGNSFVTGYEKLWGLAG